ncbi:MAG: hypothetical protein AB1716_04615 [Planctomycetota bacterium]
MIALFGFTLRQILTQHKLWLALLILLFPSGILVLVRSVAGDLRSNELWEAYHVLMQFLLLMLMLPLVCLLYGTALIGAEVEQRTVIYLLTRRLHRATVLLVRFGATWAALTILCAAAMLVLHVTVTYRTGAAAAEIGWRPWHELRVYLALAPAATAGFLAVFTTISLAFGRPLIISTAYFVVFELVLANLPVQARQLSISHLLRQTLVAEIPRVRRLQQLPVEIADLVYPAGVTGVWTLVLVVAVLLAGAALLMTVRELVPARVSRD